MSEDEYETTFNYLFTHIVIPRQMFGELDFFYGTILRHPGSVQFFLKNALLSATEFAEKHPEVEPAHTITEEFKINAWGDSDERGFVMVQIPGVKKECDCAAIAFPLSREHAAYFTCEFSSDPVSGEEYFITGEWKPEREGFSHHNYGKLEDPSPKGFYEKISEICYGKG